MIRPELIARISKSVPSLHTRHVEQIFDAIFEEMTFALMQEHRIELRGFGIFYVKRRSPRLGRNPKTGEMIEFSGKLSIHFKPGKSIQDRLNK